ncbi:cell wall-binding repeat-containing protein [Desulfosporosinus sp. Sb-LF]|uniref:cell wall-binding repeat-containing protein n=1 Tax=Desulfosporosinus sp. Sb-LF TaxID=2560027 RepID=UPI00107F2578|nr:cell wall-binding repeat-containing protein [Desulfosporosinus sp. Sb-LF]TGE34188.1 cell wall-binding protein [Desulfosporosinus sp. Sb-LF]
MITKKHFILSFFLISILVLIYAPKASASTSTERIAGYDRYQTAVAASQSGWPEGASTAIIAYGEDFPDALSAGPLAHKYNAPILLTGASDLNNDTAVELKRLKVSKVYIIGGYAVVSKDVENRLYSMNITVERIAGQDRYETALKVAQRIGLSKGIFVAIGTAFPDALSIGPIAAAKEMPLLLVPPNDLTDSQKILVVSNKIPVSFIVTGNSELSEKVIAQFPNYEIIEGADPYERNTKLIARFADNLNLDTVYVATGEIFADALAASALAPKNNNPILLLKGDTLTNAALSFISSNIISKLYIMGGNSVISALTESSLVTQPPHIASVADIIDSVQEGDQYVPPKTVTVTTTNGLTEEVPVTWSMTSIYSLRSGVYEFEGKIKNYSTIVHLSLTVTPVWNKITAETVRNGYFNFPQTVEVPMSNNTVKSLPVTWNINLININNIGTYTFEGTVKDLTQTVTLTLKVSEDSQIYFPDLALKTAVCRTLGKPTDATIYKSDVLNISSLYYNNSGITDLTGLEYFTNLKTLYLGGNNLTLTTPLITLTNLKCLELRNCGLKDLNSLTGLTSLTYLDVASNNINDFSPLRQLTNLTSLYLSNNKTLDYSPVRSYYKNLIGRDFLL